MAAIAGGSFHLQSIASFLNICTLAYLVMLAFALLKLRKEHGHLDQVNLKPLVPVLPILSIVVCLSFMTQYSLSTWLAFGVALLIGLEFISVMGIAIQKKINKT